MTRITRWTVWMGAGILVALLVGFGGGIAFDRLVLLQGAPPTEPANAQATFGVFWQAWRLVQAHYVDQSAVKPATMTDGAISGMLNSLGDTGHTRFLSPSDRKAEQDQLSGRLEGIGVEVEERDNQIVIIAPLDGSPAQKVGIRPGDVIEKVNGQDVSHLTLDQASQIIRGPQGTKVTLTVLRPGASEFLDFTITRQNISVPDVTWATIPGQHIAHVRISSFGNQADVQLRDALTTSRAAGDTSIVLDLRNDPGGIVDEAVKVASEFLTSGNVFLEQDRSGHQQPVAVQSGGLRPNERMVVLVNHGTASAAEIVAGAIQDHHRAEIIGEQTFGTGTVLHEYPLDDGSAILLGVLEWLTPNGRFIRNNGITPDQVVAEPPSATPLIPAEEAGMTPAQFQQRDDQQLLDGIHVLLK